MGTDYTRLYGDRRAIYLINKMRAVRSRVTTRGRTCECCESLLQILLKITEFKQLLLLLR